MADSYIHGFSDIEQERLVEQARILAPNVVDPLDFQGASNLLELGCAVGAELKLLAARWPQLSLTGVDKSTAHLASGRALLREEMARGQVTLIEGNAKALPFDDASFDRVLTIWFLEHVGDPVAVVREALRVLRPGGQLICTEVDNSTFAFEPKNEVISDWWDRFDAYQIAAGGDPFVGAKLEDIAGEAGASNIHVEHVPNIDSKQDASRRGELLDYLERLLLSGAESMKEGKHVEEGDVVKLVEAFRAVREAGDAQFHYYAYRLTCSPM